MAHLSEDIKDLLDRDNPKTRKWTRKVLYFLALLGLLAIIAGAVNACQDEASPTQSVLEEAK